MSQIHASDGTLKDNVVTKHTIAPNAITEAELSADVTTKLNSGVTSVAGKTGVVTLTKSDIGLDNVDNTSDLDKPASTATLAAQTAAEAARDATEQSVTTGLSWSGTIDLSAVTGPQLLRATLTGNITGITLPTLSSARTVTITLILVQDMAGMHTLATSGIQWSYGITPVLSTAAGAVDIIHLLWTGTNWMGLVGGMAMA